MKKPLILLLLPLLFLFSCASQAPQKETPPEAVSLETSPSSLEPRPIPEPDYLTIIAVGDNLFHSVMIREGEEGDYESIYDEIKILVQAADIAFINQETLLAGKEFGLSGYPLFNSPQKLGRSISASGFNVINHATNHVMDKGEKAILATLDLWDTIPGASVLGIHRSIDERSLPLLVKKNNITVGFLSYTYGTNGITVPKDKPYLVSLINTETMAKEIESLRPLCDFLIVSMHWGEEYKHNYNKSQENLAAFLAERNVDLVIGHHPHVIQPIELIQRPDGKCMLCYYSLGNFISAQILNPVSTMLGAMAFVKIKKEAAVENGTTLRENTGIISITDSGAIPIVTHYEKNYTGFKVYPLYNYTEELADKHLLNQGKKQITLKTLEETALKIFGEKKISSNPFTEINR